MARTSTLPRTWMSVATLLTTMAFGCDGADDTTSALEPELARKTIAGDAGGATDDAEEQPDGSVASVTGDASAPAPDGGAPTVTGDQPDAAVQLTDDQIYGILAANNEAELSAAAAAEGKLGGRASELASVVTRSANLTKARLTLLASLAGLRAEDSEQSADRERVASDANAMLETEPPSDSLDLRYAFAEAMTNQTLAALIDSTLLPQADSELLKTELRTTRDTAKLRVTQGGDVVTALAPSVTPEPAGPGATDSETSDSDTGESDAGAR